MLANLFAHASAAATDETFTTLLARGGMRIERIVSTGQTTPEHAPYDQDHDEWVVVLAGAARLWIDGDGEHDLCPGDHLLIPARHRHRVTWTDPAAVTIWLAVHLPAATADPESPDSLSSGR